MWLLPSLGRPQMLKECIATAIEAKTTTPCRILIDKSDTTIDEYRKLELPKDWEIYLVPDSNDEPIVCVGKSIRTWIKENKTYCDNCHWIGFFNDDHRFITKEWDQMLLDEIKGLRVLCVNDRWLAPSRLTGPTIWTGDLFRLVGGWIYPPGFCHMYIDNVWEVLGMNTGTWCAHMGVLVDHDHWSKKKNKTPDLTTQAVESFLFKDKETMTNWMNNESTNLVNRIKHFNQYNPYQKGIHMFLNTERVK